MRRRPRNVVLAGWVILLQTAASLPVFTASEQAAQSESRPRVVLALGGGGAKGAAHIGVLRELEEMRVPVDAIVGTSIGAIVGGLYAAGLSVDELETSILTLDWADAFHDSTARDLLSFRRKEDDARLKVKARIGFKDGRPALPLGFLQGQRLSLILKELTLRVSGVEDFDRLPIPFRAVTTDLETGESVVLGSGDLATAIRASMSIPAAFEPVELDGRLLIDGGLTSNLPIRQALAWGADVIIAVDVGAKPLTREELTDPIAVANQAINILMGREAAAQIATLRPRDIYLRPEMKGVNIASFLDAAEIIPRGAAAARAAADRLRELALPAEKYAELALQQRSPPFVPPQVTAIQVTGDAEIATGYITSRLHTRVGDRVDIDTLYTDLERVYGLGLFESVGFRLVPDPGGASDEGPAATLVVDTRQKTWGTSFARLGIDLATDLDGDTSFDLGLRYIAMPINKLGGEWRTDLSIGELVLVGTEFYQPLNIGGFFVAPRAEYRETNLPIIEPDGSASQFRLNSLGAALDVGRELGTWGEVRLGLDRRYLESDVVFGPDLPQAELDLTLVTLRFAADTLDNSSFPTRGFLSEIALREGLTSLGGEVSDLFAELQINYARTFGRHTLNLGLEAAGTIDNATALAPYTLGGFLRLSGLRSNALRGNSVLLSRLVYFRRLGEQSLLGQPIYAGFSIEGGNTWVEANDFTLDQLRPSGSIFFGADTVLGPAYIGVGFGEDDAREYYLLFGRRFGNPLSPIFDQ